MHLTDEQLNEYLDNETAERAVIEAHLATCGECATRLFTLQALFADLGSLPEVNLSTDLAARFTPSRSLTPQLPRWLTLTATLQAAAALLLATLAAPFAAQMLEPYSSMYTMPSPADILTELQFNFFTWTRSFGSISLPEFPPNPFALPAEITPVILAVGMTSMLLAWAFSNWWLLHKKSNRLA